jgi:hypothetical protein
VRGLAAFGGGIYLDDTTACIKNSSVTDNEAKGGKGTGGTDSLGVGGDVYIASGVVGIKNTKIKGNHAFTSNDDLFP